MIKNALSLAEYSSEPAALFIIAAVVIVFIMGQAAFFLIRAIKHAKKIGMDMKVLKRTARRSAIFAIAPAISIFIGVAALAPKLGLSLPWLRLSVIGSLVYETAAAETAVGAMGLEWDTFSFANLSNQGYVTIAFIMTIGCLLPLLCVTLFTKKYSNGMLKMENKDKKWGEILPNAMFMGVVSCFFATNFTGIRSGLMGWIPVFVILISAAVMLIFGLLLKITKWRWLTDYALPVSMIVGMICSVPIYNAIAG